eukprot:GSA25T00022443001.1
MPTDLSVWPVAIVLFPMEKRVSDLLRFLHKKKKIQQVVTSCTAGGSRPEVVHQHDAQNKHTGSTQSSSHNSSAVATFMYTYPQLQFMDPEQSLHQYFHQPEMTKREILARDGWPGPNPVEYAASFFTACGPPPPSFDEQYAADRAALWNEQAWMGGGGGACA